MSQTVFLRLLQAEDKAAALADAIVAVRDGEPPSLAVHVVDPGSFRQVPGSPFAYWVSERIRQLFRDLPPFESEDRRLRLGDHPSDDFRYLRLRWEIPPDSKSLEWLAYYKGGQNRTYFDETCLVVDWDSARKTYRGFYGRPGRSNERPSNYQYFLLPGLTCPNRPHLRGYFSHVPPGGIFGHTSPMLHLPAKDHWSTCAILNSNAFIGLLHLLMPRGSYGGQTLKYEVGYVRSVPIPLIATTDKSRLEQCAKTSYELSRSLLTTSNTSHVFCLPALLQVTGDTLVERIAGWQARLDDTQRRLADCQRQIDEIAFRLYGIDGEDRRAIEEGVATPTPSDEETEESEDDS